MFKQVKQTKLTQFNAPRSGFTLLESIISLAIIMVMVAIYAGFALTRSANRHVALRAQAAAIANEELNALRRLNVNTLIDGSGAFRGVLYNAGNWSITQDSNNLSGGDSENDGGHVGANVLELAGNSAITNAASGRMLYPAGAYGDGSIRTKFKVLNDSPNGWGIGLIFRASDTRNEYRVRVGITGANLDGAGHNLVVERLVDGVVTVLDYKSVTCAVNTWYSLRVELASAAPTIKVYLNGVQQYTNPIGDTTFTSGAAAVLGWGGVHAYIDNVKTVVGATTGFWTWDAGPDLPASWIRLGLNNLADGTPNTFDDNGGLTIATYPQVGSKFLKKVTVTVSWAEHGQTKKYILESLIGRSTIGQ
jgi:prepilin-type N-terminal cleavage/methylation domain-containing protein